jgi:2-polyprenyl-6-hydroxyphenyl methylase / 3-demethylubiquinone-9 3-methyltransferase
VDPGRASSTVDDAEIARFSTLADRWWDEHGDMRMLHRLNPVRIGYIRDHAAARFGRDPKRLDSLAGLRILDVGCGVTVDYRCTTAEALADAGERFDIVLAMEVVEHVADLGLFARRAAEMVKPGGLLVAATINRTLKSFALAIVAAEYVLGWLPRGTHRWEKLVTPDELERALEGGGLRALAGTGVLYNPLAGAWQLSDDMDVNYMMVAERPTADAR